MEKIQVTSINIQKFYPTNSKIKIKKIQICTCAIGRGVTEPYTNLSTRWKYGQFDPTEKIPPTIIIGLPWEGDDLQSQYGHWEKEKKILYICVYIYIHIHSINTHHTTHTNQSRSGHIGGK